MGKSKDRPFVVISGLPGSGKTTLARRVGAGLGLPLLDKDDILERLFELKGMGDAAWRRVLSRESDDLLRGQAVASEGAVIVSFWHLAGMPADSGTPTGWLSALSDRIVHIRCVCPQEVAAARFFERRRHPGHLDTESTYSQVVTNLEALTRFGTLQIEPVISVDTSVEPSIEGLVEQIQAAVTRCPTSAYSRQRPMES
jgi:AAA domain